MANLFMVPQQIITGENAVSMSMDYIAAYGKKGLIVTDELMVKLGNISKLTVELDRIGIGYEIFPEINTEPAHTHIDQGVKVYRDTGCDFLIAVGGGSPIDAMKAIGAVAANGGSITEYQGKKIEKDTPPTIAIPTTAGTGSEATKVSIITNTDTNVKMLLSDPKLMVRLAVIDPVFTLTSPPHVTAATGIDALTHAIEAYTSLKASPMTDLFAKSAVTRIFGNIYEAYSHGDNIDARREMAIAALEAGIAFSNASVTIIHGMSRPIGALFHVAHGQSNAMLLGVCMKYFKSGAVERLNDLAKAIGVHKPGMTSAEGADVFMDATLALLKTLNIKTLQELGISEEAYFQNIPKMANDALASGSPANTRRQPDADDIMRLYKDLWREGQELSSAQ